MSNFCKNVLFPMIIGGALSAGGIGFDTALFYVIIVSMCIRDFL